jgi:hypothetical protein
MRCVAVVLSLLIACDAGERTPAGPRPDEVASAEIRVARSTAQRELDHVARAVLERYRVDAQTVPDSGLLQGDSAAPIDRNINVDRALAVDDPGVTLTNVALPLGHFQLRAVADMQAEADRTHTPVAYIFIHGLQIEGDRATFWVGVQVTIPDHPEGSGTCCCSAEQVYVIRGGSWTYAATTSEICS